MEIPEGDAFNNNRVLVDDRKQLGVLLGILRKDLGWTLVGIEVELSYLIAIFPAVLVPAAARDKINIEFGENNFAVLLVFFALLQLLEVVHRLVQGVF